MGGIPFGGLGNGSNSNPLCFHGLPLSTCASCMQGVKANPGALQAMTRGQQMTLQAQAMQAQMQQHMLNQHMQHGGSSSWHGNQSAFNMAGSAVGGQAASSNSAMKPDPKQPDTLGWREWSWSDADKMLKSPSQGTLWPEAELVVPNWDDGEAVRGVSGVHAHLVPKHWKILDPEGGYASGPTRVHGIVERFGRYVLGTEGWRAEWVVIKELKAPSTEVGLALEQAYPDVIIHYPDDEEDAACTLVKSSKSGKGSRPTNRPKPSPSPSQSPSPSFSQAFQQSIQTGVSQLSSPAASQQSENSSRSSLLSRGEKKFLLSFVLFCVFIALMNWMA